MIRISLLTSLDRWLMTSFWADDKTPWNFKHKMVKVSRTISPTESENAGAHIVVMKIPRSFFITGK